MSSKTVARKKTGAKPKVKSRSRNYEEEEELAESDEEQLSGTIPSTSRQTKEHEQQKQQANRKKKPSQNIPDLENSELKLLVFDCVYYLLIADQKKHAIKKIDIIKHVIKEHSKIFGSIMKEARVILRTVYGLDITELEGRKGQYMLINLMNVENIFVGSESELGQMGLILTVLTLIFMNGNNMSEAHLWQALKRFGLNPNASVPHPLFGDVKKLLTQELVKKLYLEYNKIPGTDPPIYEFKWGPRALKEAEKLSLLDFVCNIYGNSMTPEQWTSQYQDAVKQKKSLKIYSVSSQSEDL